MKIDVAAAGNAGPRVRSDCEVILELTEGGGIKVDLNSKVKVLYGDSIIGQVQDILGFYGISNAKISVIDSGALPFVISARVEAAVRKLVRTDLEYLPEMLPENGYGTERDRFRFSRLYLPGNTPGMMINAGLHTADGLILDLEDSVAPDRKDEARILVRNALRQVNFNGAERMVRINQGDRGIGDLQFIVPHNVNLILIPKCESAEYVRRIDAECEVLRKKHDIVNSVYLMPIIETALGVEKAFDIAGASAGVVALAIGLEDYTADLGVQRSTDGIESLYARTRLVVAARAAGVQPIDSVFSDVGDMDGLRKTVSTSKALGFEGMGCIHPRQVQIIREGFAPGPDEIERSKKIVLAFEDAMKNGLSVVALGTKMIDPPVVARATKTIGLAVRLGLLSQDWINETVSGQTIE